MTNHYVPPDDPADPVAAALTHLILEPETVGITGFREPLQQLATLLDAADAFAGLRWEDACDLAGVVAYNVVDRRPAGRLSDLAAKALAGDGCWCNPGGAARAFNTAATLVGAL